MSARENILKAIAVNKPALVSLPELVITSEKKLEIDEAFIVGLKNIGATPVSVKKLNEAREILEQKYSGKRILDLAFQDTTDDKSIRDSTALDLETVYVSYLKGSLGVAENGAIWMKEPSLKNRLVPFISEHLVIVLNIADLVYTMHDAYEKIKIDEDGYGVFIAGPSKTADIEQSLVIGAHGPRSLEVFLVG